MPDITGMDLLDGLLGGKSLEELGHRPLAKAKGKAKEDRRQTRIDKLNAVRLAEASMLPVSLLELRRVSTCAGCKQKTTSILQQSLGYRHTKYKNPVVHYTEVATPIDKERAERFMVNDDVQVEVITEVLLCCPLCFAGDEI